MHRFDDGTCLRKNGINLAGRGEKAEGATESAFEYEHNLTGGWKGLYEPSAGSPLEFAEQQTTYALH